MAKIRKKIKIIPALAVICAALIGITSCSLLEGIGEFLSELTTSAVTSGEQQTSAATEEPEGGIPFRHTPEIGSYSVAQDEFPDELEEEASGIIDEAISKALAYLEVMRDDRHSKTTFEYDEDSTGYISELSETELSYYRKIVGYASKLEQFKITDSEYPGGGDALKDFYFSVYRPLAYCEPGIASYFCVEPTSLVRADFTTFYTSVYDVYFDPYRDGNASVKSGKTDMESVKHAALLLDRVVKRIVRFMPEDISAYDKYYYLAAVLSERTVYDKRPDNCFTAFGALIGGRAVCEGYACAYYLLCKEANLWCAYRDGLPEGVGHGWNMIKLDSGIYNVDVTWCDGYGLPYERDWYDCFVKSDAVFVEDGHCATSGVSGTGEFEASPYEEWK